MTEDRRGIEIRGVRFRYRRSTGWRALLQAASPPAVLACDALTVRPGLTLLLGPNGSGKSTLLKLMAGIEMPESGTVRIDGRDLWADERAARLTLAYVPEQPDLSPYAALGEVLRLVASLRGLPARAGAEALAAVGLGELQDRSIRELSMGQRRRAMFASAFVGQPSTLLLDEPLETLDRPMREAILRWVEQRVSERVTTVISTHEIEPFLELASAAIVMRQTIPTLERLPNAPAERLKRLDGWARGEEEHST